MNSIIGIIFISLLPLGVVMLLYTLVKYQKTIDSAHKNREKINKELKTKKVSQKRLNQIVVEAEQVIKQIPSLPVTPQQLSKSIMGSGYKKIKKQALKALN